MSATIGSVPGGAAVRSRFYVNMAIGFLAIAFVGFLPTYWIPMMKGTLDVRPIAHVHAVLFYGWLFLYLGQALRAASGNMTRHREWGVAGVAIATASFVVAIGTAMASVRHFDALGLSEASRRFMIVPISQGLLFAGLVAAALLSTRNPEVHKRLMLTASATILIVAIARLFIVAIAPPGPPAPPPVFVTIGPAIMSDLLVVGAMVHDRMTLGRVHPVYWIALGCCLAVQVLRIPLSMTDAWLAAVGVVMTLAP